MVCLSALASASCPANGAVDLLSDPLLTRDAALIELSGVNAIADTASVALSNAWLTREVLFVICTIASKRK
jgi:hypothetical protein